jgi:hypothetical protein
VLHQSAAHVMGTIKIRFRIDRRCVAGSRHGRVVGDPIGTIAVGIGKQRNGHYRSLRLSATGRCSADGVAVAGEVQKVNRQRAAGRPRVADIRTVHSIRGDSRAGVAPAAPRQKRRRSHSRRDRGPRDRHRCKRRVARSRCGSPADLGSRRRGRLAEWDHGAAHGRHQHLAGDGCRIVTKIPWIAQDDAAGFTASTVVVMTLPPSAVAMTSCISPVARP